MLVASFHLRSVFCTAYSKSTRNFLTGPSEKLEKKRRRRRSPVSCRRYFSEVIHANFSSSKYILEYFRICPVKFPISFSFSEYRVHFFTQAISSKGSASLAFCAPIKIYYVFLRTLLMARICIDRMIKVWKGWIRKVYLLLLSYLGPVNNVYQL